MRSRTASPLLPGCALLLVGSLSGCGGSASAAEQTFPDSNDPAYAAQFDGHVDPRVSTSRGAPGGFVVLWPRIVPADPEGALSPVAADLQRRLVAFATEAASGGPIDVRPEPQRVCPRAGCEGASVGAAILHVRGSCAVIAVTSTPGPSRAHLDAWAGRMDVINNDPPFRDPPEEHVRVQDFVPCDQLGEALDARAREILTSVRAVRRAPG
ncbi:MAG TPA: hypothetical protein ENK57_15640 [Polyangiaceae bacterium]|nr:hypothetical protein [Polyangiaceae bacterium]